jgi:hypothetical protein
MADHERRRGQSEGYFRDREARVEQSLGQYGRSGRETSETYDRYQDEPRRTSGGYGRGLEEYPSENYRVGEDGGGYGRDPGERSGGGYGRDPLGDVVTSGEGRMEEPDDDPRYGQARRRGYRAGDRPEAGTGGCSAAREFADLRAIRRYDRDYGLNQGSFGYGDEEDRADYGGSGGFGGYGERLPSGAHRGRGPRGYRRSDARILEDVNDRLTYDEHLDASDIEVSVSDCEVTLQGMVSGRRMKRHAEDITDSVPGVTHVQNNLRVSQSGVTPRVSEGG